MADRAIMLAGNEIKISFPYRSDLVHGVRQLPQRRWDPDKVAWFIPFTPQHAARVLAFGQENDFTFDEDVLALAVKGNGLNIPFQQLPPGGCVVELQKDKILIRFPYNIGLVEEVKQIPGRKWEKDQAAWSVPVTEGALAELVKFIERYDFTGHTQEIADLAGRVNEIVAESIEASKAASADFEVEGLGGVLRPFQKAGVKYAIEKMGYSIEFIPRPSYDRSREEDANAKRDISTDCESTEGSKGKSSQRQIAGSPSEGDCKTEGVGTARGLETQSVRSDQDGIAKARSSGKAFKGSQKSDSDARNKFQGGKRTNPNPVSSQHDPRTETSRVSTGMGNSDEGPRHQSHSTSIVQGGLWESDYEDGDRAGWPIASESSEESPGLEKKRSLKGSWVVSHPGKTLGGVLIGDEPGLGKTIEALAVLQATSSYPAFIICPATIKYNWYKEIRKWLPGKTIQMLGTETFGQTNADLVIMNYDQLKRYRDYLVQREFKAVICDESHYLKSGKAQRTMFVEEIVNGCIYERGKKGRLDRRKKERFHAGVGVRLLLSGTPLLNRPEELVPQLQILDRLREFGGWYGFMQDFCGAFKTRFGMDTSGSRHLKQLNDRLRSTCYIRRTKAEVLKELPPKQRTIIPVELTNRSEYDRAERDLVSWLRETAGHEKADAAEQAEQLVRIEALKQLSARGKMAAIKEWVDDFLDTGEKLLIFGWHKEIVLDVAKTFRCDAMYGGTPLDKRQPMVDRFQDDPNVRLMALNVQTGGVGLNLTAASNVVFAELGWNPGTMNQASDRCHRIGQTDNVMEWWFIGVKTIDVDIQGLIEEKRVVVDAVTDGAEEVKEVSVFNELVARLRGEDREGRQGQEALLELF